MTTTEVIPSLGDLLLKSLLGSVDHDVRRRVLLRDAPPMRAGEFALPASSSYQYVATTRLISPKRVHWPRVVATVWRKPLARPGSALPMRLASITWCHEWIASARLFDDYPAEFDIEAECNACVAGHRAAAPKARP